MIINCFYHFCISHINYIISSQDNVIEETMTVDAKHHRYFVAKRGEILRNIGEEFGGVTVSFPRPGVTSDKVNVYSYLNDKRT